MKKFFITAAIAASAITGANAQHHEHYAPEQGDFGVEVRFNPFGESNFSLNDYEIKGRYFVSDKDALVLQLGINGVNRKSVNTTIDNDGNSVLADNQWTKYYYGTFNIDLGYERHFFNYKRIDLYAGGRIGYGCSFAGQTTQNGDDKLQQIHYTTEGDAYASNNLRIAAFTGIDFYVYKGLYLGAEIGLGMVDRLGVNTKTKATVSGATVEHKSEVGGHDFQIETYVTPTFRLGWTF